MAAPMMRKIHRAVPPSFMLIDLANAGEAIIVINPTVKPTFNPSLLFNISQVSLLVWSLSRNAFNMPILCAFYNTLNSFIFSFFQGGIIGKSDISDIQS